MRHCEKVFTNLLMFGLMAWGLQGQIVAQDFTFAQTGQGFYWPLGIDDTQFVSKGGTWLNRDSTHGGGADPSTNGNPYLPNLYHNGVDMFYNNGGSTFGAPVYAIATGTVVAISGPDTPDRQHGWGPPPAVGILIRHTLGNGQQFLALYGHIASSLRVGDVVTGGRQIGTVAHYYTPDDHLHFGIYPLNMFLGQPGIPTSFGGTPISNSTDTPPDSYSWGNVGNDYWPSGVSIDQVNATATLPFCTINNAATAQCSHTNGFVNPVAFIKGSVQPFSGGTPPYTNPVYGPACQNGSSQYYLPYGPGQPAFHPDGTIVQPAGRLTPTTGLYGFLLNGITKQVITSRQVLNTLYRNPNTGAYLGFDIRDIVTVSNAELNNYSKVGPPITSPIPWTLPSPNGRLLKDIGGPTVGIVTHYGSQDGVLIPFATWEAFSGLGYSSCNWAGAADFNDTSKYPRPPSGVIVDTMRGDGQVFASDTEPPTSFTANAAISPSNPNINQSTTVNVNVVNNGGAANEMIVDIEIYNSAGTQVYQDAFDSQYFTQGLPASYAVDWTPSAQGAYTAKVGVFDAGWSHLEYWNDNASTFFVGNGTPQNFVIDIWWPTDGASVSGTQPFKALLESYPLSSYAMYWQVDNGQPVLMWDSQTDYPHKEASVDLTGWNWRGTGPYNVNFIAKDSNGNVLTQKSVNITVTH